MTINFDKWLNEQGPTVSIPSELTEEQITILKKYPDVAEANDLPFDVQEQIIALNEFESLQGVCDAYLAYQYSLVTLNVLH